MGGVGQEAATFHQRLAGRTDDATGQPPADRCRRGDPQKAERPNERAVLALLPVIRRKIDNGGEAFALLRDARRPEVVDAALSEFLRRKPTVAITDKQTKRWLDVGLGVGLDFAVGKHRPDVSIYRLALIGELDEGLLDLIVRVVDRSGIPLRIVGSQHSSGEGDDGQQAQQRTQRGGEPSQAPEIHTAIRYPTPRTVSIGAGLLGRSSLRRRLATCTSTTLESPS